MAAKKSDEKKAPAKPAKKAVKPQEPTEFKAVAPINGASDPVKEVETQRLRCDLTPAERTERLEQQNKTLGDIREIEEEKKKSVSEFDQKKKERLGHLATLRDELDHGVVKDVKVEMTYDPSKGKVSTVRMDTGESLGTRQMTGADRQHLQEQLPFIKAEKAVAESGAKVEDEPVDAQ